MPRARAITRTFSLNPDLVKTFENEAHSREISTSALLNQTLDRVIKKTWPGEKAGVMAIGRFIIKDLLDEVPNERLIKIAESSAQQHKVRASLYGTEQRLESVLDMMDKITGPYFGWFTFTHLVNGRDHRILLTHGIGQRWSVWLEAYFVTFFMEMLGIPLKSSITDGGVLFEFRE